jgi:polyisoprenoid-binding protein YceI
VGFNIRHFFTSVHGRFTRFDGTIVFDPANLAASSVTVTIRDSSINTANERRDAELRGADFFWTEKHPTITFASTKVNPGPDPGHFQVAGDLTIRGISKPVVLDVEFLGMGQTTVADWKRTTVEAGFSATTRINRKDWGIVWNKAVDQGGAAAMMLGDDVNLLFEIAARADAPPAAPATGTQAK